MALKIYFICFMQWYMLKAKLNSLFKWNRTVPQEKSVLFLCAFFPGNAGYEWRVAKWSELLRKEGYKVDVVHCVEKKDYDEYDNKTIAFLIKFLKARFKQVLKASQYETVIVRRELLPFNEYGNHFLEKLLRKKCANLILDIDDDLSASKSQPKSITTTFGKVLCEDGNSFRNSFRYYDKFYVASNYLKAYVLKHTSIVEDQIAVIPTCVDYDRHAPKKYGDQNSIVLGWIGGPYNFYLLNSLLPVLDKLATTYDFSLHVIADGKFDAETNFPIINKVWSLQTEVTDLLQIDVGLMPLDDTLESKGKGGFKLIQYMGLGIVSVASAITINSDIVEDGINSFLVQDLTDWELVLEKLFKKEHELEQISEKARERISNNFSFEGNRELFLRLLKK